MIAAQWYRLAICAYIAALQIASTDMASASDPPGKLQYNRDIRPILSDKCFRCHGPDAAQRQANLRLDRPASDSAGSTGAEASIAEKTSTQKNGTQKRSTSVIVPGEPQHSELFRRIAIESSDERMPPVDSGSELSASEINLIRRWIAEGAEYQPHWAFVAPQRVLLPTVQQTQWPRGSIDHFVLAQLERNAVEPSPEADRATWLRRVSLDLIGLPPTLAEIDAFLSDESPTAYESVVDRLLASPHFGERMTLDWLDGARYADTNGFFSDFERPIWRWRDWVINAFNRNQPFDQFTIEQLAGDLLPEPTIQQKIATGFHRNHMVTNETGIIDEEYRVEYVADRVETTGSMWLGLTIGCARCHDHKYDPISQREYYELFAFFNNVPESGLASGDPMPVLKLQTPEYLQEQAARKVRRATCEQTYQAFDSQVKQSQAEWANTALTTLPQPLRKGLVAELRFDNDLTNSVATDEPAQSPDPPDYQAGIRGTSLKFASPFFVTLDRKLSLNCDQPWTISAWISVEGASLACILSKMETSDDSRGLEITWLKGRLKIGLIHRRDANAIQIVTRTPTAANRWHHLTLSYDGSLTAQGLRVYIDGQLQEVRVDRDTLTASIANDQPWSIGRKDDGLGFSGRIDQLRLYARALSDQEIRESLYLGDEICGILETPAGERTSSQQDRLKDYFIREHATPEIRTAWIEMLAAQQADAQWAAALPKTLVMEELPERRKTFILERGQYDQPSDRVEANVPSIFPSLDRDAPRDRLALARWLVHPDHPLTCRVIVNRYWTLLMGEGLVKTANDFGLQGELPSHPELLDWLAVEFRDSGWDLKGLLKQIVLSATYRQSAVNRPELLARDPENRWLARGPRFRLSGELLRDQALAVSGLLSREVGGASVKPYQPPGLWEAVSYDGELTYEQDSGGALFRRSLYTFWKRQAPPPTMLSFDSPTRETCAVKRPRTNTPLQALVLLNDPTYLEAARKLAERVLQLESASPEDRIRFAFRLTVGRVPSTDETVKLLELQRVQRSVYQQRPDKARQLLTAGSSSWDKSLDPLELASWTMVASVLLNLDEVINKP